MYTTIHNVKTTPRGIRAYIYKTNDISIYGDFYTPYNVNKHTLTLLRRSYTVSVSYWLAPMYVEYSARVLTFKKYSSQHVHNASHTAQVYKRMYCIHIVVDVLAFKVKMYNLHSLYTYSIYSLYYTLCIYINFDGQNF